MDSIDDNNVEQSFADRLKIRMRERAVRQVDVSEALGIGAGAVSNWVSTGAIPRKKTLNALASFLQVPADWLLTGQKNGVTATSFDVAFDSPTLPNRIKLRLKELRLSNATAQDVLGVSYYVFRTWLDGKKTPNETQLEELALILDVTPDWLLNGDPIIAVETPSTVASRIDMKMAEYDVKKVDITIATGVTLYNLNKWLDGSGVPQGDELENLSALLGVTSDWLLNGDDAETTDFNEEPEQAAAPTEDAPVETMSTDSNEEPEQAAAPTEDAPAEPINDAVEVKTAISHRVQAEIDRINAIASDEPMTETQDDVEDSKTKPSTKPKTRKDDFKVSVYKNSMKPKKSLKKTKKSIVVSRKVAKNAKASTENSFCYYNDGDSMSPKISDNALCIADSSKRKIKDGRIYAFKHGILLRTSTLYKMPDGGLIIRSINENCEDEIITAKEMNNIEILGWVYSITNIEQW